MLGRNRLLRSGFGRLGGLRPHTFETLGRGGVVVLRGDLFRAGPRGLRGSRGALLPDLPLEALLQGRLRPLRIGLLFVLFGHIEGP